MNPGRWSAFLAAALLGAGCLVRHPVPDPPPLTASHETRRTAWPDGTVRREMRLLVWSDHRTERDGLEREFHSDGSLAAERGFDHDRPSGVWRTWYPDGTPRSEIDFGTPGEESEGTHRFWHPNGRLEAEGTARGGVREGRWRFWNADGSLAREGDYRSGVRDGPWVFYDVHGGRRAAGEYARGVRVGPWSLWDEHGERHVSAESVDPAEVDDRP